MLRKILGLLLTASLAMAANAASTSATDNNGALYHGYEGQQYVADTSASTAAYVPTQVAEKFRPFRVQIFVPGLFIGRFGGTADYKINNAFAIGGLYRTWTDTGNYYSCPADIFQPCTQQPYKDFYNVYGLNMEYAVNGNLNLNGWILNPRILEAQYRFHDGFVETSDDKVNKVETSTDIGIYLMHQWAWPTGIYMQLGIGADYMSNPNNNIFSLSNSHFGGDWDFTIGYAF